jgi:hypothetical protein
MSGKIGLRRTLKVRLYNVVSDTIRSAIAYGWNRVWKHREPPKGLPEDEVVIDEIHNAVMNELSELIDWGN